MESLPNGSVSPFNPMCPAPPRVNMTLLIVLFTIGQIFAFCLSAFMSVPDAFSGFLVNVVLYAWPFYICLWMKKLNPKSISLFFLLACVAVNTMMDLFSSYMASDSYFSPLGIGQMIIGIAPFLILRMELQEHYTEREPIGLKLNLTMTLLFSFFYFQGHLNKIAQAKNDSLEFIDLSKKFS